ncbi:MAG: hypothetical protein EXX96DRAFT_545150 [Benjaminiella poitrasii]|nr:MAG: hypothetical protein EXX96DRAFT_545150 [Benjaminiella poitrasii]
MDIRINHKMNIRSLAQDPLFNANVRLFIKDIYELERLKVQTYAVYRLHDHFIRKVDIYGIVVAIESRNSTYVYSVDDGTAVIECFATNKEQLNYVNLKPLFQLGDIARIIGHIIITEDGTRQIEARTIYPVEDANAELLHYILTLRDMKSYRKKFDRPELIMWDEDNDDKGDPIAVIMKLEGVKSDERVTFQRAFLRQIQANASNVFSPTTYRDIPELVELAKQALRAESGGEEPKKIEITAFFNATIQSFFRSGCIIEVYGRNNLYKLVDNYHLAQLIIDIIREAQQVGNDISTGIFVEYMVVKVSESDEYRTLCRKETKIREILDLLVKQSIVYSSDNREYKLTS